MTLSDHMATKPTVARRRLIGLLAAAGLVPACARAQSDRPVRMIVPTSAGAGLDVTFRVAQAALSRALGSPVIMDNQAGAGGVIGYQLLARASPDGSVIGVTTNNLVILPSVLKSLRFDVSKDFTPIAVIGTIPVVLVVNPDKVAAVDAAQFVALLKSRPDTLHYASSGSGTVLHLASELLLDQVGAKVTHVPYKGVAPMMTDLIGGQVDFAVTALPVAEPYIRSGKLRAIGVCTAQRSPIAPDIPTFVEQGFPDFVVEAWVAVIGPKGMAPDTVDRIHNAVAAAFTDPAVSEAMVRQGTIVAVSTPAEAQATISRDLAKYAALTKKIGLQPQ